MNTILLAITAIALVVLVALVLRPVQEQGQPQKEEDERISPLLRGINYLLSDEPDLALQEMVQVARLRSEAADVYMALGEMFRSKGEIGRAVRIHQNLLARPDLPRELHLQAHLALALDFQTGGLLDRALTQYQKALDIRSDHAGALESSLRIREQSSEWLLAEELLSRLERVRNESYGSHRAYLFSEMARQCCKEGDRDAASEYALRAIELDSACAPARMVEVELALQVNDSESALSAIRALREKSREHFPLVIALLVRHQEFYESRGYELLTEFARQERDAELVLAWLEVVASAHGRKEAAALCDRLGFVPATLRESLRLQAVIGDDSDAHAKFSRKWRLTAKNYSCEQCGVEVAEVRWQCPQCHAWGTLHPKQEEKV
ncbi:Lipopolysaccharide biosynthesis regulator YciM, contains six TPR domains and a predicted metal-binding C-terminal domain [Mariprofundus ferrinatatus]|uniref:Lipopolysaccharide biosynthesis regulator YciM, contains six TPR domains and a predicted metal-binding C-terminal domain n=1 Tax=Mariprofundus ferrinatatus TaxID=1921087 RepID=A0A2K8L5D0_9PROT|nr:heat-shock protein [Mariprofundus ferrinatatus]ATX81449.1 Lipopolysaccharide biosynthesis regulator YciM, contains six TPR domains and a predicted metal-binding C-terminal domain [Mariprofundus ferrinatatus]